MTSVIRHIRKTFSFSALFFHILLLPILLVSTAYAEEEIQSKQDRWSFLAGYGSSQPGWGRTETKVETVDVLFRYSRIIIPDSGSSWYQGHHSILIEPVVHFLTNPNESPMVSLNFLGCYTFTAGEFITPYIFGGGGPVYVSGDITDVSTGWNGNYQFGVGMEWKQNSDYSFLFEFRYHHVSNGNREEPNIPLNSAKFLVGFTF